ncbi:O-antigen ligase family protein [bacterium]|nr:O-antigen ligase family protein [bacterium]
MPEPAERFRKILFHVMAAVTTVIVPLSISTATLDPGLMFRFTVWAGCLAIVAAMVMWGSLRYKNLNAHGLWRSGLVVSGTLYVLAAAIGFWVAIDKPDWLYATLRTALLVAHMVLFALILMWNRERWQQLTYYSASFMVLISLVGIVQWGSPLFRIGMLDPPYGTMMHENLFASFLFLSTPLTLYGAIRMKKMSRLLFFVALLAMVAAVVVSTTRATWIALTLGAAIAGMIFVIGDRKIGVETLWRTGIQKRVAALALSVVLLAGAVVFVTYVSDQFDDLHERTLLWQRTLELTELHPVTGLGAGNWVQYTNIENMRNRISQANWIRPHNDPLWVLSETGALGLIGYLGLFATGFWLTWRAIREAKDNETRWLAGLVLFALLGFFLISNSGFPRERLEHSAYFATYLALSFFVYRMAIPAKQPAKRSSGVRIFSVAVLLLASFATIVGIYRTKGESRVRIAHAALASEHYEVVVPVLRDAKNPFFDCHPNGLPIEYMRGIAYYEQKQYLKARENFEYSVNKNSYQGMSMWWLGRTYVHTEQYPKAAEMFMRVLEWWPDNVFSLPGLALSYYQMQEYELAYKYMLRYQKQYDPQRHRQSYASLWQAIQQRLTPEQMAALDQEVEEVELRRAEEKRGKRHIELIREKQRERLGIEPSRGD